jgi:predicted transglutaminase-like cysteine proteinase
MFALSGTKKPVVICCALALLVPALGMACTTNALADSRDIAGSFSNASLQQPSSLAPSALAPSALAPSALVPSVLAPSPARFFTINAVLAKHDSEQHSAVQVQADGAFSSEVGTGSREENASDQEIRARLRFNQMGTRSSLPQAPATSLQNTSDQSSGMTSEGPEPFGLYSFKAPDGVLWRKWRGVEADIDREKSVLEHCEQDLDSCPGYAAQFLRLIKATKSKSGRDQLDEVNRGVNIAIRYVSDMTQYGEADRWSAPLATFASGKGDCEDFAIAKYVVLREAGLPADHLRILLVRDRAIHDDHAVVAVRHDGRWLIMDNRYSNLMDANLTSDSEALSFTPLFAINDDGVHLFAASYADRAVSLPEDDAAPAAAAPSDDQKAADHLDLGGFLGAMPLLI